MRPALFTFLLSPFLRFPNTGISAVVYASKFPPLQQPVCRRNFTCTSLSQNFQTIMGDMNVEQKAEAARLAEPAANEAKILEENKLREAALKEVEEEPKQPELPKLTPAEFRVYNSMAEHMEYFHNHFRQSWTLLYNACENGRRPASMSMTQFLSTGLQFISHLTAHHGIEEQHIFPVLAKKMPEFKNGKNAAELLRQHKAIHAGMDVFEDYLRKVRSGETELDLRVLKTKMDSWGEVLWTHLDQEVRTLGAENMRKYWTMEEMRKMPM